MITRLDASGAPWAVEVAPTARVMDRIPATDTRMNNLTLMLSTLETMDPIVRLAHFRALNLSGRSGTKKLAASRGPAFLIWELSLEDHYVRPTTRTRSSDDVIYTIAIYVVGGNPYPSGETWVVGEETFQLPAP